ncbi:ABC transporter substrate-binding protein [uncultured Fusobacterium sp.]|uniref:ABC transporter substrate-binding protein n=1 Tax=uncultured Fusobacterium sp. TaxID=159267 RepID=UPI0026261D08|nr:ABC transporter substrate-binding protein [uncultured Fusobacterium sp.]
MKKVLFKMIVFFIISTSGFSFENEINNLFEDEKIEQSDNLVIEQEVKVETIDPILLRDTYSRRATNYIYAQLFKIDKDGQVVPYLLEEYKKNDEMEIYCKLRKDIYFSNGDSITAQDVKDSIENYLKNGYMNNLYSSIQQIQVLNDREFLILLNYPDHELEIGLTNPLMSILKRENNKIFTSGRYTIEEIEKNKIKLKKNKYYFDQSSIFENVEIKGELNSYQRLINSLNLPNYYSYDLYKEDIETAKKIGNLRGKKIVKDTVYDIISLVFGNKKNYSLNDRKALESLLNREATTICPQEMFDIKISFLEKNYSRREAIKILKNSGHFEKKIKIMCLNTIHNRNFAQYVAHDLIQNGLNVDIEIYNLDKFLNKLRSKDYDIALYNITINSVYPLTSLEKTIVGELIDYELEDSLLPFFNLFKEERNKKYKERIIDKIFYLTYSSRYFIPLAHKQTYILKSENIVGMK